MNDLLNSFLGLLPDWQVGGYSIPWPAWGGGSLIALLGIAWVATRDTLSTAADIKTLNAKPAATPKDVQDAADDIKAVVDDGAVKQDAKQEEILKHLVEMKEQKAAEAGRVLDEQAKQTFIEQVRKVLQSTDAKKGPAREALADNRPLDAAGELMKVAQQEGAMADDVRRAAKEAGSTAAETFREAGGIYYSDRPDLALEAYREAARLDASDFNSLVYLSRLEDKQGGDVVAAKTAAEQALQVADDEREKGTAVHELGKNAMTSGDLAKSGEYFQTYLEIVRTLAEANPGSSEAKRDVSIALEKLGDVAMEAGDTDAALGYFTESLEIRRALASANPGSAVAKRDVSVSLNKLGDVYMQAGDTDAALGFYTESLDIRRAISEANPGSSEAKRDVSVSLNKLGDVAIKAGDTDAALRYFTESSDILRVLASANPGSAEAKRDVSVSLNKLGDVAIKAGDTDAALGYFTEDLEIARALSDANPSSAEAKRDVIASLDRLGKVTGEVQYWQQALVIAEDMEAKGQFAPTDAFIPGYLRDQIAAAGE